MRNATRVSGRPWQGVFGQNPKIDRRLARVNWADLGALRAALVGAGYFWPVMRPARLLLSAALVWLAYATWVLSGQAIRHHVVNDAVFQLFPWAGVFTAWSAARRPELDPESREAWRFVAIGMTLNTIASAQWLIFGWAGPVGELPLWTSVGYLVYYPLVLTGLTRFPTARRLRAEARRAWLDAALVTTGLITVSWYLLWTYTPLFASESLGSTILNLLTLGSDLYMAWASWTLMRGEQDPDTKPAMRLVFVGMLALAISDSTLSLWQVLERYRSGTLPDAMVSASYLLLAAAPVLHRRSRSSPLPEERPITARSSPWPVVALVCVIVPLFVEITRHHEIDQTVLILAAITVMAMEVARQSDIRRQNRRLATARAEQDARFRSLVMYSHDMTFVCDRVGRLTYTSPSAPRQLGMGTSSLTAGDLLALIHPADRPRIADLLASVMMSTPRKATLWRMGADGTWRDVEGLLTDLTDDPTVRGIVLNVRDVSERERLEEQLRESQKMEAIGRLAGGIAHDFNNILAAVMSNAQLLQETQPGEEASDIEDAARRGAALVRQLLEFSRGQAPTAGPVNVGEVVTAMSPMLRRLIGREIDLVFDVQATEAVVWVDRGQVEQVILNLVINARDAMPDGGSVRVETWSEGDFAVMRVSDTGMGMDAETRARVFEPFFTTKPRGRGTGLGLATVYGIVTKAGGEITVDSLPGAGTRMQVRLPVAAQTVVAPPAVETPQMRDDAKLVLVVDDEDALRMSIARFLERRGFRVLSARDGLEALASLAEHDRQVDLVLTDIVMPRLGGIELAQRIAKRPGGPVVLCMTGHAGRTFEAPPDAPWHPDNVLIKPFDLPALVERISAMVAAAAR